jgi:hypothetical protein
MSLWEKTKRLVRPFISVHGYLRKEVELLWHIERCRRAAKTRSAAETQRTAIHEAGHAVVLIALGLVFSVVSIIPDVRGGTLGQVYLVQHDRTFDPHNLPREEVYLRYSMAYYAGAEAIRQLLPTHPNPEAGASADYRQAASLIRYSIGGDAKSVDFLVSLAKRRCALVVDHYKPEIQALAGALEAQLILSTKAARKIFRRSLTRRAGRILSFPSEDEGFRALLRRLNLPTKAN